MEFMRAGGYAMWVVLLFGGITMTMAVMFALNPTEGRLGFIRGMSTATVFATISGVAAAVGATFRHVANHEELHQFPDIAVVAMVGLSESLAPAVLGFSMLGIVWFTVAIGLRRLAMR